MRHLLFVGQGMEEGLGNKKSETKTPGLKVPQSGPFWQ